MQIFELIARYIWPAVLAWNVFLFQAQAQHEKDLSCYKLYVAQNYIAKQDLEKMFAGFEHRFDEKLGMIVKIIEK